MSAFNRFCAVLLLTCTSLLPACGGGGDGPPPIRLTLADSGSHVTATAGQEIDVVLPVQVGVYGWGLPSISSDAVRFLDASVTSGDDPSGFGGVTFRFRAVHSGAAQIGTSTTGDTARARWVSFVVDVTVT